MAKMDMAITAGMEAYALRPATLVDLPFVNDRFQVAMEIQALAMSFCLLGLGS